MRVDGRTLAADQLQTFVNSLDLPVLGSLRDTQNYLHLAARGLTVFDVAPSKVERDLEQWKTYLPMAGHKMKTFETLAELATRWARR